VRLCFEISEPGTCIGICGLDARCPGSAGSSQASSTKAAPDDSATKWDIFGGYSYIAPHGTIVAPWEARTAPYTAITGAAAFVSIARYFNKYVGVEGVGDVHLQNESQNPWVSPKDNMSGGSVGIDLPISDADITPFVHALVGADL
jgi:hypothetical protein